MKKKKKKKMDGNNNGSRKPHAIMIPYPHQGHINPFVHLAIKLASQGFIITFVNTHSAHHQISKAASTTNQIDWFFMSHAHTSKEDIAEIAHGISQSGVDFVWVLRLDIVSSDETDVLPIRFEEKSRLKD